MKRRSVHVWCLSAPVIALLTGSLHAQSSGTALVRHAPALKGEVVGSVQQLAAEPITIGGGATISGNLLVPGSPTISIAGKPVYGGTLDGTGDSVPANYQISLQGNASLQHVVRRTNPVLLPQVAPPPAPTGTRDVTIDSSVGRIEDFSSLRNVTVSGNAGQFALPPGTYGQLTASGNAGFTLGVANSTSPAVYNIQSLILGGKAELRVIGPVIINVAGQFSASGVVGSATAPSWLIVRSCAGPVNVNAGCTFSGYMVAPAAELTIGGSGQLVGGVIADRLTMEGNTSLRLVNLPPVVYLASPPNGQIATSPATFALEATASDIDGAVTRVEFFNGATKLGESSAQPYQLTWPNVAPGTYTLTAKATDNTGAVSLSSAITVISNSPPTIDLTSPTDNAVVPAPGNVLVEAIASDSDGTIAKVEFFQDGLKIGEATSAPYRFSVAGFAPGTYSFSAKAFDNQGASTLSVARAILVDALPTASIAGPAKIARGEAISLTATAGDSDGMIAKVEFYRGSTLIGTANSPSGGPSQYSLLDNAALTPGIYAYRSRSYDNKGLYADSDAINITVLATLPYMADFEPSEGYAFGPLAGQLGWTGSSGVIVTDQSFFSGARSASLSSAAPPVQILQSFAPLSGRSIVFVDFFARPVADVDPGNSTLFDLESSRLGFVRSGTNGVLEALDGDGQGGGTWRATKFTLPLTASYQSQAWVRLTGRIDFSRKLWDVYANGNMVAADLKFRDQAATYLSAFAARGNSSAATQLDYLFAGAENPLFVDANNDGIDDAWEAKYGLSLTVDNRYLTPAGNGVTVIQAYINGTDPNDYYQGIPPTISPVVGGGGQTGPQGLISVRLTQADGSILANAPVTVTTATGVGKIATTPGGSSSNAASIRTDAQGAATVYATFSTYKPETITFAGGGRSVSMVIQPPATDSDANGLPDLWEVTYFGHADVDPNADPDGDGISNLQEFKNGTNPADYYNGVLPQLASQVPPDGSLTADGAIGMLVTDTGGRPLVNAPVLFSVKQGGHHLSPVPNGAPVDQVTVRSDVNGLAKVYILPGN